MHVCVCSCNGGDGQFLSVFQTLEASWSNAFQSMRALVRWPRLANNINNNNIKKYAESVNNRWSSLNVFTCGRILPKMKLCRVWRYEDPWRLAKYSKLRGCGNFAQKRLIGTQEFLPCEKRRYIYIWNIHIRRIWTMGNMPTVRSDDEWSLPIHLSIDIDYDRSDLVRGVDARTLDYYYSQSMLMCVLRYVTKWTK